MGLEEVYDRYKGVKQTLCCPICHKKVNVRRPAGLICKKGHCFDISGKGYINFLSGQKQEHYSKELFASRRAVFDAGYYEPLAKEITRIAERSLEGRENVTLLDAGCGEGYYTGYLSETLQGAEIYGLDSAKEAVVMAAKRYPQLRWIVGNLANLPFQTDVVDVLLEIFAPANYKEFLRVLRGDGRLIKVIPGDKYLKELRGRIESDSESEYTSLRVAQYFSKHIAVEDRISVSYIKGVSEEMKEHFLTMSPLMFGKNPEDMDLTDMNCLTFDFEVLIGKKK